MNHFKRFVVLFSLILPSPVVLAESGHNHALEAHVHGVATLQVAVDKQALTLNFSSPLDNLLGFERKARNQAEVAQVQNMIDAFYKTKLFVPTPSAQCKLKTVDLHSIVIKEKPNAPKPQHEEAAGHADLDAELVYACSNVKDLRDLQVNLFKTFPNLHQLTTEIVSARGQTATKLTPANTLAAW